MCESSIEKSVGNYTKRTLTNFGDVKLFLIVTFLIPWGSFVGGGEFPGVTP